MRLRLNIHRVKELLSLILKMEYNPAHPKPGKKTKSKIKNTKSRLHDLKKPESTNCRICGKPDDGTCYYHHCEAPYLKNRFGKGIGKKVDDFLVVWGHNSCGTELSKQPQKDAPEIEHLKYEIQWSRLIFETHLS